MNKNYEKYLKDLKEQILKDGNTLVSKRDLLERFCEIDEVYNGSPWNLVQILSNINILIGQKPCEKAVSVQDCINAIENTDCELSPQAWKEITTSIMSLPPVMPKQEPVLDKIKAEIEQTEINGYIRDVECFRAGINVALNVINKYKAGNEK